MAKKNEEPRQMTLSEFLEQKVKEEKDAGQEAETKEHEVGSGSSEDADGHSGVGE